MFTKYDRLMRASEDLEARVGQLEGILDGIQRRLEALHGLTELVAQAQSTAHKASERSQNALAAMDGLLVLPDLYDDLKTAVAHGIEHVERTEARIRATVQRARKELADDDRYHPGLEAEAGTLRLHDGSGGGSGGLPAVSAGMAQSEPSVQEALTDKLRKIGLSA